jgi:formate-dependent nitrite reductase membrane component NrfD
MWGDVIDDDHMIGAVGTSAAPLPGTKSHPRTEARTGASQGLPEAGPLNVGGRMSEHMVQEAFNVQHKVPWHWPIAVYVTTKHLAGGIAMVLGGLALTPALAVPPALMVGGGVLAMLGLAVTLGLLVYDLERPDRFFFLLVRPQWRSWIARAAWILTAFSAVFGGWWFLSMVAGPLAPGVQTAFAVGSIPLGWLAATYTAFLFAQAEGRDLWQAPHMPAVLTAQAVGVGATALAALGFLGTPPAVQSTLLAIGAIGLLAGGLIQVAGDSTAPASENGRRALASLRSGRFAPHYWGGLVLGALLPAAVTALGLPALGLPLAAVGITLGAWAWLEAPQQIPNS